MSDELFNGIPYEYLPRFLAVARRIEEAPAENFSMKTWLTIHAIDHWTTKDEIPYIVDTLKQKDDRCGTSGCIAGWVLTFLPEEQVNKCVFDVGGGNNSIIAVASNYLGINTEQARRLFDNYPNCVWQRILEEHLDPAWEERLGEDVIEASIECNVTLHHIDKEAAVNGLRLIVEGKITL